MDVEGARRLGVGNLWMEEETYNPVTDAEFASQLEHGDDAAERARFRTYYAFANRMEATGINRRQEGMTSLVQR